MAEIVNMPKLGFDMAEGTLVRWVVHEGETIAKGSVLAEIETDKATVEVEVAACRCGGAPPGEAGRYRPGEHAHCGDRRAGRNRGAGCACTCG